MRNPGQGPRSQAKREPEREEQEEGKTEDKTNPNGYPEVVQEAAGALSSIGAQGRDQAT